MKNNPFHTILIIGLGLMGGSFLKKIKQSSSVIYGIEPDVAIQAQIQADFADVIFISYDDIAILQTIDLCIITLYPQDVLEAFNRLDGLLGPDALVIDISGIKKDICEQLQKKQALSFQFILTHPMAGREMGGYENSLPTIFEKANFIVISDIMQATGQLMLKLEQFVTFLGFEHMTQLGYLEHDLQITYTSQLSHILAVSLLNSADYNHRTKDCIGDSFRDLTRIANMNIKLWETLFFENKELLASSIGSLIHELEQVQKHLACDEKPALHTFLERAKWRRLDFDKK
ncbi:prephenate dehydrogenase [Erysipelotrichaceae bacterium]|nr:prephenate dehydrogenase [Erysipelotrichaceae bacterium]